MILKDHRTKTKQSFLNSHFRGMAGQV